MNDVDIHDEVDRFEQGFKDLFPQSEKGELLKVLFVARTVSRMMDEVRSKLGPEWDWEAFCGRCLYQLEELLGNKRVVN